MKSYKITFQLSTPLSFMTPPTFDGILAYAYAREMLGEDFQQGLSITKDDMIDFSGMPIAMHPKGYFMASTMFWDDTNRVEFTERWRKHWDARYDHLVDKPAKIRIQQGKFKSYDVPYDLKDIKQVWFYFQSDNVEEVGRLLVKWVAFLGKKRAYGNGLIDRFVIQESDFNFEVPFRPIPTRLINVQELTKDRADFKFSIAYCAYQPPYWLPDNFENCMTV